MALPSSGQISLGDVRTETSQSAMINYSLPFSLLGYGEWYNSTAVYAPVNVYGDTSWTENTPLAGFNYSMSIWHSYNHSINYSSTETGSLFFHDTNIYGVKSMIIMDAGTTDRSITINLSGSTPGYGYIEVYHGKPWKNNGIAGSAPYTASISKYITGSFLSYNSGISRYELVTDYTFSYDYDATYGQYLYVILINPDCIEC